MINKLVFENLKQSWVRTLLISLVVGVQVMLILTLVGLSEGMLSDSATRLRSTGADIILKPSTQGTISLSNAQVEAKFVDFVAKQPHVKQAVGMFSVPVVLITTMNGVNFEEFEQLNGGFHFVSGGPLKDPDDLVIDDYYARQEHYNIGKTVSLLNHNWKIVGIVKSGLLSHLIVSLHTLQHLQGDSKRITQILVKVDNPALVDSVVKQLNVALKNNLTAISIADFVSQLNVNTIPALKIFITVITGLSMFVGSLVVFLSMYMAVVERTREIGILKALGAKPGTILDILIREAVVLALSGCVLGIILSYLAKETIMVLIPASLQVVTVPSWWPIATAIMIGGALVGTVYPGFRAARQDAIEALAYE